MTRSAHFYPGGAQLFGLRCAPLGLELVGGVFVGELQFFLDNVPKSGMTLPAGGSAARRRAIASHLSRASLGWQMKQNVVSLARSTTNRGDRSSAYREAICGICHPRLCNITFS